MYVIGFATEFYTLWNMEITPMFKQDRNGNSWQTGTDYQYTYIKNISTDLNKVKQQYPNTEIDDELKGVSDRFYTRSVKCQTSYIDFGKYCGKTVEEVVITDFGYIKYLHENSFYLRDAIEATAQWKEYRAAEQEREETEEKAAWKGVTPLKAGENRLTAEYNIKGNELTIDISDNHRIILWFDNVKDMYYNGYSYQLPIFNGKAMKIKGKELVYELSEMITHDETNESLAKRYGSQIVQIFIVNNIKK